MSILQAASPSGTTPAPNIPFVEEAPWKLPSAFQLGEELKFFVYSENKGLNATGEPIPSGTVEGKIVGVTFLVGKVLYDIALKSSDGTFFEEHPLQRVDSIFFS